MSNEKLREALQGFLTAMEQGLSIHLAAEYARQALATTEPEPTGKQSLQVEPAVNQQLTTEPFDEREAFEREMMLRKSWNMSDFQPHTRRGEYPHPDYLTPQANTAWAGWQARAAMAKGVK